jgi:hypothetical protein
MIAEAAKLLLFASPAYPRRPESASKKQEDADTTNQRTS